MIILKSFFEFYEKSFSERDSIVGRVFREDGRKDLFFPLLLSPGEFNYGNPHGLVAITTVRGGKDKWFKVAVASPDDLDLSLEFDRNSTGIRWDVVVFLKKINKRNVTYLGVLTAIKDEFSAGKIFKL